MHSLRPQAPTGADNRQVAQVRGVLAERSAIALNIAQHTSASPYVGGCSLLPEDTDVTEIIIRNVVPIVFLPQYARFENMADDARCRGGARVTTSHVSVPAVAPRSGHRACPSMRLAR